MSCLLHWQIIPSLSTLWSNPPDTHPQKKKSNNTNRWGWGPLAGHLIRIPLWTKHDQMMRGEGDWIAQWMVWWVCHRIWTSNSNHICCSNIRGRDSASSYTGSRDIIGICISCQCLLLSDTTQGGHRRRRILISADMDRETCDGLGVYGISNRPNRGEAGGYPSVSGYITFRMKEKRDLNH